MKKRTIMLTVTLALTLALCGCAGVAGSENGDNSSNTNEDNSISINTNENIGENSNENETTNENPRIPEAEPEESRTPSTASIEAVQEGPYGRISVSVPDSWSYEACPIDSDALMHGMYGIHLSPKGASDGYIELAYVDSFGVCGTGLVSEKAMIAGSPASIGTYDNNEYWSFVSFREENDGIVAWTCSVEDWWSEYGAQALDILDTLSFNPDIKEGGAYVYSAESSIEKIGLSFSLKNISATGATLVFYLYDENAPTGSLDYSEDFTLEVKKDGKWEEAPIVIEGKYAFEQPAYMIKEGITEMEMEWKWLYGELAPGEYRLGKSVNDFRESGDFDKYTVYAQFILN